MSVYVDSEFIQFGRMKMCHMLADTEAELEDMAIKLKLKLCWWQYKGTYKSHFDISKGVRDQAIKLGAEVVDRKFVANLLKQKREIRNAC